MFEAVSPQPGLQQPPQNPLADTTGYVYWADKPAEELIGELKEKERYYFDAATRRGLKTMWSIAWAQYYGTDPANPSDLATQTTARTGPESEFTRFRINEVRSFIKQQNVIALGERPAFQCLVLNSDHDAVSTVEIADAIVEYLYKKGLGEDKERQTLEMEGVFGSAHAHLRWDFAGGDEVDVMKPVKGPDGMPVMGQGGQPAMMPQPTKSGEPHVDVMAPWEVVQGLTGRESGWCIVRERASKSEIMATYPELRDEISSAITLDEYTVERLFGYDYDFKDDDDDGVVKHFYHPKCKAMPDGRYVGIWGDVVLWDEAIPVPEGTPVIEMCSGKFIGSSFGYADSWDLISIQEMIDQMVSDTASNLTTFGRNTIVYDKGSEMDMSLIAMGLRALAKTPGSDPPQAINYASMPDSVQWFIEYLHGRHESISGLNAVARGQTTDNVKSGQMAALYHSIAIEFQNARQAALDSFREKLANMMLDMVRSYAEAPFLIEVTGVEERPYLREFTKQNVSGVRKVRVETTNPMMRSQAGRFELFTAVTNAKVPPEERDAVIRGLSTGDWSGWTEASRSRDLRVLWENEQLSNGAVNTVLVAAGDNPFKHVPEHWALFEKLSSQEDADPMLLQGVLSHILEHCQQWQYIDPRLATLLNIPLPPPMPGTPTAMLGTFIGSNGATSMPEQLPSNAGPGAPSPGGSPPGPADSSGVKLPNSSKPPAGSNIQGQPS